MDPSFQNPFFLNLEDVAVSWSGGNDNIELGGNHETDSQFWLVKDFNPQNGNLETNLEKNEKIQKR